MESRCTKVSYRHKTCLLVLPGGRIPFTSYKGHAQYLEWVGGSPGVLGGSQKPRYHGRSRRMFLQRRFDAASAHLYPESHV